MLILAVVAQTGFTVLELGIPALTGFIKADLGLSAAAATLPLSAFALGKIFGSYAAGIAADRVGERRVLIAGGLACAVLVCGAVLFSGPIFFLLLVAAGVAGSVSTPAGGRLVLLAFPRERVGLALSIRQTSVPIGGLLAAAILPWIASAAGWRWSLVVASCISVVALVPLALARLGAANMSEVLDLPQPVRVLDRDVLLLTAWGCLQTSGTFAVLAFLALDMQSAGVSLATGSIFVAGAMAAGIFGRIAWGAASDRLIAHGRKPLLIALTAVSTASMLLLFAVPRSVGIPLLAVVCVIVGFGLLGFQGLWITMLAEAAGPRNVGATTGLAITFMTITMAISTPLYGFVADVTGSYRAVWAAVGLALAVSLVPALLVRERVHATAAIAS